MDIELLREETLKNLIHRDINKIQKIYLDITKIDINKIIRQSTEFPKKSEIILSEDIKGTKLSLINIGIDIIDPQNNIINIGTLLREKEINKENCLGKSILNILNIDNFKKKNKLKQDEKGEEKSEEDK